jgi:WD40 repeat protein
MSTDKESGSTQRPKQICFSREDFLRDYILPVQPAQDFEWNGVPAQYADGHPKEWGDETEFLDFAKDFKPTREHGFTSYTTALSSDKKLLAISIPGPERILVYDVSSKNLCQVLEGAGPLCFRPITDETGRAKGTSDNALESRAQPAYTLISEIPNGSSEYGAKGSNQLILWELDQNGRLLDEEEPIDASVFATQALDAILPDLIAKHEWTKEFIDASTLHTDFAKALGLAAAEHCRRHNTIIADAHLGTCNSTTFSTDGKLLMYHTQNDSTQWGMREPENLPRLVIYDLEASRELHRLSGHTDTLMWSGISPDGYHVATVSWDGTMRMYLVSTGEFLWATEDSGGQSWSGAFSPNSEHIVWSSASGLVVSVHEVASGKKISTINEEFRVWCRCLSWHPDGSQIALSAGNHAYVWLPFQGQNGTVTQHFSLDSGDGALLDGMSCIENIFWECNGRYLCLQTSEESFVVYDTEYNTKKLFRRPVGQDIADMGCGFHGMVQNEKGETFFLSVDGDVKVRYWHVKVDQHPSWWEKQNDEPAATVPKKTPFPETGKYVKVTRPQSTSE